MTLPKRWELSPIGDLCDLINGRAFRPTDWANAGLPIIRIQNLNRQDADYNFCDFEVDDRFIVEPGELLFAWSGTPGTSFGAHVWNGPRAVLNQHIFRVRYDNRLVDRDFFKRAINSTLTELIGKAHGGVGLAHVTKGKFEATEVPIPPLAEQRRIVAKLDALTARLARARAELDRVPVFAQRLRNSILDLTFESVGSGLISLGEIGMSIEAGKNLKCDERPPAPDENGVVKVSAVSSEYFLALESKTLPKSYTPPERDRIVAGDLLLARASGSLSLVGRVALVEQAPNNLFLSDKVLRLRVPKNLTSWIYWFLRSPAGRSQIEAAASGISMHNITQGSLLGIRLSIPADDVRAIKLGRIAQTFARADRVEAEAARARALIDRLESAILAKAFRGELVPQDPNDEPASVLLDRIRAERAAAPKAKRGRRAKADA